jgi:hypothetical protein
MKEVRSKHKLAIVKEKRLELEPHDDGINANPACQHDKIRDIYIDFLQVVPYLSGRRIIGKDNLFFFFENKELYRER